jgi:hypothetical protein
MIRFLNAEYISIARPERNIVLRVHIIIIAAAKTRVVMHVYICLNKVMWILRTSTINNGHSPEISIALPTSNNH